MLIVGNKKTKIMKIAISWNELPKYAAYPIAEIIKKNPEVEIISIRSALPNYNLEKIAQFYLYPNF